METALDYEKELESHIRQERAAVTLSSKVGELLYDKGIELVLFRNQLVDITISEILNLHEYSKNVVNKPIDIMTSSTLAVQLHNMDLAPAKIDLGKLSYEWLYQEHGFSTKTDFLNNKLADFKVDNAIL